MKNFQQGVDPGVRVERSLLQFLADGLEFEKRSDGVESIWDEGPDSGKERR